MLHKEEQDKLISNLAEYGIVQKGHFLLTSGKHAEYYINKDRLLLIPFILKEIRSLLVYPIFPHIKDVDVIVSPVAGAVVLGSSIANYFDIPFVYAEKMGDSFAFRKDFATFLQDKKVLVVEDIITTGGSVVKVINKIEMLFGKVTGIASIWNRRDINFQTDFQVHLINEIVEDYLPENCPLCKNSVTLTHKERF